MTPRVVYPPDDYDRAAIEDKAADERDLLFDRDDSYEPREVDRD